MFPISLRHSPAKFNGANFLERDRYGVMDCFPVMEQSRLNSGGHTQGRK